MAGAGRAGLGQVSAARHCDNSPELSWQNLGFAAAAGRGHNSSSPDLHSSMRWIRLGAPCWSFFLFPCWRPRLIFREGGLGDNSFYCGVVSGI